MESILHPLSLKVLESFSIVKTLYAFDFDGTLAPIVDNPSDVRMDPEVAQMLETLNKVSNVAILSGRSIADLKKLLPFEPRYLIGNHGIEGTHPDEELSRFRELCQQWKNSLTDLPTDSWIEDKEYSLTIHFRTGKDRVLENVRPLREKSILEGKNTINILPAAAMNKGQALDVLMKRHQIHFGFFIGDDKTDETVFVYKNSRILTVKVGQDLNSHAKYYLSSQDKIKELLSQILSFQKNLA